MKKLLCVFLFLLMSTTFVWSAGGDGLTTQSLDQTVSCPGGGNITLTGTYNLATSAISVKLLFANCTYSDTDESVILNGSADVTGTLPLTAGNIDIKVTLTNLKGSTTDDEGTFTETCSGDWNFKGTIDTSGSIDVDRTTSTTCNGTGRLKMSLQEFLSEIMRMNF